MTGIARRLEFGQVFGHLVVLDDFDSTTHVRCACRCGVVRDYRRTDLRHGSIRSCGCARAELLRTREVTHGKSSTPEYKIWSSMKARCGRPSHPSYERYGGRGITVCARWASSFEAFVEDMGPRPDKGFELDRENNDLGYDKQNCRWVPRRVNCQNTSQSKIWVIDGVEYPSLEAAASARKISIGTVSAWCKGTTVRGRWYPPRVGCWSALKYGGVEKM